MGGFLRRGGASGQSFSSYEYDFVDGVYSGAKYNYTSPVAGAGFSSFAVETDFSNAYAGAQFFYTGVSGAIYSSYELDLDKNSALSRIVLSGILTQPYDALEFDYSGGVSAGFKVFYTGASGAGYAALEEDFSATGQLEAASYTGMTSTPYASMEQDFVGGALHDTIFTFSNVTGSSYYAYQVMDDAFGNLLQQTVDYNSGAHSISAFASGQTLTSVGDDTMTGCGATTFLFNGVYGVDVITNFAAGDTIALPTTEFANFAAVLGAAQNSGPDVVITASDHDTLTLKNMTVASLTGMSGAFSFHG